VAPLTVMWVIVGCVVLVLAGLAVVVR